MTKTNCLSIYLSRSVLIKCFRQNLQRKSKQTFHVQLLFHENREVICKSTVRGAGQATDDNMGHAQGAG